MIRYTAKKNTFKINDTVDVFDNSRVVFGILKQLSLYSTATRTSSLLASHRARTPRESFTLPIPRNVNSGEIWALLDFNTCAFLLS